MAETGWRRIDSFASGEVQANEYWDSITRSNNTVTINGLRSQWRVTVSGNDSNVWTRTYFNGVERQYTHYGNPSWGAWNIKYGNQAWFSISVGANDTQARTSTTWGDFSGSWNNGDAWFSIPALGSPSGTTAMDSGSASPSQLGVRNDTTSWGSNATSGSVRSYIADNSSWSGQTYKGTSDNALVIHTGLTSNKRYWFRGWSQNGGGKSAYHSSTSGYTLPLSCVAGTPDIEAVSATIPVTQDNGGGAYTITKQYRLLKTGDVWGEWTTFATDIELTGLLPSTEYQVQVRSTTSAGTTEGATTTFTTLPAAKLVMLDGTVKNAIPRVVHTDGTVEMVKVNHV